MGGLCKGLFKGVDHLPMLNDSCNLSAEEFQARLEVLRSEFLPHLLDRSRLSDGQAFDFDRSMRDQLESLVTFERQCCPDLHWRLLDFDDRVRLEIRGLTEDQLAL